jgi:uncharacterized alkaline shock family protein YloU
LRVTAAKQRAVEPAERGNTTLADKVVEKIAAHAATEVEHASGLRRHVAGRELGTRSVRASATLDGHVAVLRLELAVDYPTPVKTVTRTVRAHVARTVEQLCGLRVDHLDITVAALRRPDTERSRVQ